MPDVILTFLRYKQFSSLQKREQKGFARSEDENLLYRTSDDFVPILLHLDSSRFNNDVRITSKQKYPDSVFAGDWT